MIAALLLALAADLSVCRLELWRGLSHVDGWQVRGTKPDLAREEARLRAIFRRAVRGRSLVVDPGIHAFGWSRERVRAYLRGVLPDSQIDELVDRIAAQPAQLTSYEAGGLELERLRAAWHGDVREFHRRILEGGPASLATLRERLK